MRGEKRRNKRREEKSGGKSPLNDVRSRVVNIRLYGCRQVEVLVRAALSRVHVHLAGSGRV